jgi:cell division protein FtsQ
MRRTATSTGEPLVPLDIRFMNGMSMTFASLFVLLGLLLLTSWLLRQPIFNLSAISVKGEMMHNNAVTLRANVAPRLAGNFFTVNLAQTRASPCHGCAKRLFSVSSRID